MKTTRKVTLVLLVLMSALTLGCAQTSNVRGADRLSDASKPDYPGARALIQQALENPETKDDAKTWYTAGLIEERAFTGENQKSLKNEPQDLPSMYKALLAMHEYYKKTYEVDHQPNDKGKVRPKFEKKIANAYKDNILYYINAGGYYMEQKDFKSALQAFQSFREIKRSPLFEGDKFAQTDSNSLMVDFFAIITAYQAGDKKLAIQYGEELKNTGYRQNEVYQILAQTYIEEGDTTNYITTMREGLRIELDSLLEEGARLVILVLYNVGVDQVDGVVRLLGEELETLAHRRDVVGRVALLDVGLSEDLVDLVLTITRVLKLLTILDS